MIVDFRDDYVRPSGAVAGQDIVDGGAEDDVLAGGGGDDQLIGGTGNDHLWGDNLVEGNEAVPGDPSIGLRATYFFRVANTPGNDELDGGDGDDLLLGNLGGDLLIGHGGNDYLQGDGGGDQLEGGAGIDTLVGGSGHDILKGGSGLDTYIIRAIDGADTIEDADGKGVVEFDHQILLAGLRLTSDPANVFHSPDGSITFTKSGADLVVTCSGPLTIKNFATGQLEVRLVSEAAYAAATRDTFLTTVPDPNNPPPATIQVAFFDEGNNHSNNLEDPLTDDVTNFIHALGGADTIISGAGDDQRRHGAVKLVLT